MAACLCSTALYSVQPMCCVQAGQPDTERQSQPRISSSARRSSCGNSGRACCPRLDITSTADQHSHAKTS